ncbi:tape measure [Halogranum tailed virus 1]|uniref:Tape measure n=1 Tax=Halogranum tailed virus 1 TaxID=1273749 RepID=R4TGH8_9CAUD|nr:tape measure [Halogranum tailed virus 1]AGM11351.1 tape measure [Halogranum tailed virus 1]
MAKNLSVLIEGVETVSRKMDDIEDSVQEVNRSLQGMSAAFSEASGASAAFDGAAHSASEAADDVARNTRQAARGIDKMGEDAVDAAAQLGFLSTVMDRTSVSAGALSVNVGAFTIALRQLHTQLPLLLTTFGSLGAVAGGLTAAIVALTGAMAGLLAGGAIAWSNQLQENFAGITSHAEAMEAIMGGFGDLMEEVFAPVSGAENIELLINTIERFAELANRSLQAIDAMRDSFVAFFEPINMAIDSNFNRLAGSMQALFDFTPGGEIETAGEALQRLVLFAINRLPDMIDFFSEITAKLSGPLSGLMKSFLALTRALVRFAESAAEGVLPIIEALVNSLTGFFQVINELDAGFIASAAQALVLVGVGFKLLGVFDSLLDVVGAFGGLVDDVILKSSSLGNAMLRLSVKGEGFFEDRFHGLTRFGNALLSQIPILNAYGESLEDAMDPDADMDFADAVNMHKQAMAGSLPTLDDFREKIRGLRGGSELGEMLGEGAEFDPSLRGSKMRSPAGTSMPMPDILSGGGPSIRERLSGARESMRQFGKTAIQSGKSFAMGFGQFAKGGIVTFHSALAGMLHPALFKTEGFTSIVRGGIDDMAAGLRQMGLGIIPQVVGNIWGMITSLWTSVTAFVANEIAAIKLAFAQKGVMAGFMQMAASAWAAVTGLVASAASMIVAAVSAISLNAALGGLPLLLGAIVTGAALLVGAIGNMDGIVGGAKSSFEGLKNFAIALGQALLNFLVPYFNVLVDVFEMLMAPVFAISDGLRLVIDTVLEAAGAGGDGASMMQKFANVMSFLGEVVSFLSPVFTVLGDILYEAFIIPFKIIATVLGVVIGLVADLIGWLAKMATETGFVDALLSAFDILMRGLDAAIQLFVDLVNGAINAANQIPGVNIGKIGQGGGGAGGRFEDLKTTKAEVEENLERDSQENQNQTADTTPAQFNFEENVENNTTVNARPEDNQRIKQMVKDAMEEANTFRRKKDAYSG